MKMPPNIRPTKVTVIYFLLNFLPRDQTDGMRTSYNPTWTCYCFP